MHISQEVLDNIVCYSATISTKDSGYGYILLDYYDKIKVSYYITKGLCKKKKTIVETNFYFIRTDSLVSVKEIGEENPETLNFIKLLKIYLSKNRGSIYIKIQKIEEEYLNRTDDFSLGVIHALEQIKEEK